MKALDIRKGMIGKELNRERRHWIELTAGGEGPELPNPGNLFLWNDNTTPFFYVKPNNIKSAWIKSGRHIIKRLKA